VNPQQGTLTGSPAQAGPARRGEEDQPAPNPAPESTLPPAASKPKAPRKKRERPAPVANSDEIVVTKKNFLEARPSPSIDRALHALELILEGDFEGDHAITGMARIVGDAQPWTIRGWKARVEEAIALLRGEEDLKQTG
jgi:hypothetical protein